MISPINNVHYTAETRWAFSLMCTPFQLLAFFFFYYFLRADAHRFQQKITNSGWFCSRYHSAKFEIKAKGSIAILLVWQAASIALIFCLCSGGCAQLCRILWFLLKSACQPNCWLSEVVKICCWVNCQLLRLDWGKTRLRPDWIHRYQSDNYFVGVWATPGCSHT